jgi:hypothetical protein
MRNHTEGSSIRRSLGDSSVNSIYTEKYQPFLIGWLNGAPPYRPIVKNPLVEGLDYGLVHGRLGHDRYQFVEQEREKWSLS